MKISSKKLVAVFFLTSSTTFIIREGFSQTIDIGSTIGGIVNISNYNKRSSGNHSYNNSREAQKCFYDGLKKFESNDTNDLRLARYYFKTSMALSGESVSTNLLLGGVSLKESQLCSDETKNIKLTEAIYYYTHAIAIDSTCNVCYFRRGVCYYSIGDKKYLDDYRKSCESGYPDACAELKKLNE